MEQRRLGEIELIQRYFAPLANTQASLGLQDDAAFLSTPSGTPGWVVSADAVVAGVHFFESDAPGDVAYKALAVNVSDLAAKAALPRAYTLCLGLGEAPTEDWACDFANGLERAQSAFGIHLIGGDTVSARGAWWVSITAFGEAGAGGIVRRGGAKLGDYLYLSGTLGDAALGLKLRYDETVFGDTFVEAHKRYLFGRYLHPQPRLPLRTALEVCATAAMDVSDGLVLDLGRMCKASGCTAKVVVDLVPLSEAACAVVDAHAAAFETVLTGGDDYEILAAVAPGKAAQFEAMCEVAHVRMTRIGEFTAGDDLPPQFLRASGEPVPMIARGFEHFAK